MRRVAAGAVASLLLAGAACVPSGEEGAPTELPLLETAEVLRVGSRDEPGRALTWFGQLEIGPDGLVYTVHPMDRQVRVHDPSGRPVRTLGGPGEGPGEFRNLGRIGFLGDTLWALDYGTYRVTFFGPGGELVGSEALPVELGRTTEERPPRPVGLFPDGTLIAAPPAWAQHVARGEIRDEVVLRMSRTGEVLDTVVSYSLENTVLEVSLPEDPRGRAAFGPQPYNDGDIVLYSPGRGEIVRVERRVTGRSPAPVRVTKTTFAGDTLYRTDLRLESRPIPDDEVEGVVARQVEPLSRRFFSDVPLPRLKEIARERLYNPGAHPPVFDALLGADGTVWLRRWSEGEETPWVYLAPDGSPRGEVALPTRYRPMYAEDGRLWGMLSDGLGVPYIVCYRIG